MRRIYVNPRYEDLREQIEEIPERMEHEGIILKEGRNLIKVLTLPNGQTLNVKRYHVPKGPNRLVYSWGIRKPKGLRAFLYPPLLQEAGIETPENIAYIEDRKYGLLGLSYFISTQCDYRHDLYEVWEVPNQSYDNLAVALARFTAHMHEQGILHEDYSPGNILWKEDAEGYHFSIIDINRMYFGKVGMRRGCANFARLWGPKRLIEIIIREYARQRGFDEQEALETGMASRRKFWTSFLRRHRFPYEVEL